MTLSLPDVTVVMIDAIAHDLAEIAMRDTLKEIDPGDAIIWSDRRIISSVDHRHSEVRSLDDYNRILWYEVPSIVRTSHFLVIQYDGWVLDSRFWNDYWMGLDYLGATWPWHWSHSVGNGGFSLRSTKLAQYVASRPSEFLMGPPLQVPEDELLCRHYRSRLNKFRWGNKADAMRFAFERDVPVVKTFGFHGLFNFGRVLSPDALENRLSLASDYVKSRVEWRELTQPVGAL